jgi:FAD binding domain
MSSSEEAKKILLPYLTHPGRRYNIQQGVHFPEDCIELRVCAPYRFAARMCTMWHVGRVLLAGDAAHVFPPFGGQGRQSGFMDSSGLAWRLALAVRSRTTNFDRIFQAWSMEHKQQMGQALAYTVRNGAIVSERNSVKIFVRDWILWLIQLVPSWKLKLEKLPLRPPQYTYEPGMAFLPDLGGGISFPQIYCNPIPQAGKAGAEVMYTDDAIFGPEKYGLFQLVVLVDSVAEVSTVADILHGVQPMSEDITKLLDETTYIIHDTQLTATERELPGQFVRVVTVQEFRQSKLSIGREPQEGYDESSLKKCVNGKKFAPTPKFQYGGHRM